MIQTVVFDTKPYDRGQLCEAIARVMKAPTRSIMSSSRDPVLFVYT